MSVKRGALDFDVCANKKTDTHHMYLLVRTAVLQAISRSCHIDGRTNASQISIEVHPKFSEAPHLRSSIPYPKTGINQRKKKLHRGEQSHAPSLENVFFKIKIDIPAIWAQGTPFFRNKIAEINVLPVS